MGPSLITIFGIKVAATASLSEIRASVYGAPPHLRGKIVRRIQEKPPIEKTIWQPVSVPMARFIAIEQIARSARRRRRFRVTLGRNVRTADADFRRASTETPGAVSDRPVLG